MSARLPDGHVAILGVLPNRKKETLVAFLRSIPAELQTTIQSVCTDLYEGYLQATEEVLPQVRRVIDRFHVAKLYRAAVDTFRKAELSRLKKALPSAQYQTLKGNLWAFRKASSDLSVEDRAVLDRLFALSPALKVAYALREQLSELPPLKGVASAHTHTGCASTTLSMFVNRRVEPD